MDRLEKLYSSTIHCSEGNCNYCPRYDWKGSNNYPCRKQLLNDLKDYLSEKLDDEE